MSNIIVSIPTSMAGWFEECINDAGHKYKFHGQGILLRQPVKLYAVQNMTIEEVHLLLKTRIQVCVNAHELQASL